MRAHSRGTQFIRQPIVLDCRVLSIRLHIRKPDRGLVDRSRLIQRCDVWPGLVDEAHRVARCLARIAVAGVVDPIRVVLPVGGVFDVTDSQVIADGVLELVQTP